MKEKVFGGVIDEEKYSGQVWGLNAQMSNLSNRDLSTPNMNGATFYHNGAPSTPHAGHSDLATGQGQTHTPGPHGGFQGIPGHLTPGGGGGFGHFQYAKA